MNNEEGYIKKHEQLTEGGFTVPDKYFEKSKQQLLASINKGGFIAPEHYFNQAKADLLNRVNPPKKLFLLSYVKYAAAAILLISFGIYWFYPTTNAVNMADLNEDEIIHYVDMNGIDDHTIALIQPDEANTRTEQEEELIYQIEEELIVNEL